MALKISKDSIVEGPVYTNREIFQKEFPELWSKANVCLNSLRDIQKTVLELIPSYRKHLCSITHGTEDKNLMGYVLLCSVYAFAREINMIMDKECTWLAENVHDKSEEEIREHEAILVSILDNIGLLDINDLLNNPFDGFVKLDKVGKSIKRHLDYQVFENWSFLDIMGYFHHHTHHTDLIKAAINSVSPTAVNIQNLLNNDTAQRMY